MKRILVTGGLGFIGSHTVVALCEAGYTPIIVDNLSNSKLSVRGQLETITKQKLIFYQHDFADAAFLDKLFKKEKIDGVIHFAAFKSVNESVAEPLKYYQNNVANFVLLMQKLQEHRINACVFSSSATVYGEPDSLPLSEDAPLKPSPSPYGTTKVMCETILKDIARVSTKSRLIALRYFNPIGAHQSGLIGELPLGIPNNLVPFLTQAAAGIREELTVFGDDYDTPDGTCIRDYIHVVDLAEAHVKALEYLLKPSAQAFTAVNIGTGQGTSVLETITTFQNVTGVKVPHRIGKRRPGDVTSCYAAVDKAKKLLGWQARFTIKDSLGDAWRWQQYAASIKS